MINIKEIVDFLRNDLTIKGIYYLRHATKTGDNLMVTCPYHKDGRESSPSCGILLHDRASAKKIYPAGTVHCFTCGSTHTLQEMISFVYGHDDKGVFGTEWLLDNFQILNTADIDFTFEYEEVKVHEEEYKCFKQFHPYFAQRGILPEVAEAFDLGYDEFYDSVVLPLFSKDGKCIMLIRRSVKEKEYRNSYGGDKTSTLYGLSMVYRKLPQLVNSPYLFIVEGAFDAIRLWQMGFPAVAIMQAGISETQMDLIKRTPFQKIVIATDADKPGRDIALKLKYKLRKDKQIFYLKYPSNRKDVGEMTDDEIENMIIYEET